MTDILRSAGWRAWGDRWWMVALPTVLLAVICAGHFIGFVREDYGGYLEMFAWARAVEWHGLLTFPYRDYGFSALLFLFTQLFPVSDVLFFFFIALLGLGVKFYCFRRFSPVYWVALLAHVALFFVLHDYTQLRASLGIAFLMLGAGVLLSTKRYGVVAGSWLVAGGFHLSTLFAMIFAMAFIFSMPTFFAGATLSLFSGQMFEWASSYSDRLASYLNYRLDVKPNLFSSLKLYQYLTLMLFLYYRAEISARGWRMVELSGWFVLAGIAIFIGMRPFPGPAFRLSELLFSFMPFVISGLYALMPRRFGIPYVGAAVAIGAWMSYRVLNVWQ